MATYGAVYDGLLEAAHKQLEAAEDATTNGDLWNAYFALRNAGSKISEAMDLLEQASKVAFERVFKEKA